jgi:hypothetical protein
VIVPRGPSLASCSAAIAAAVVADAKAREERESAHQRWFEQAARAVDRRPDRVKWVDPLGRSSE